MIKIIKEGKVTKFTKTCPDCGCEFEYEMSDLQTDYRIYLTTYPGKYNTYVVCPCCGKHIHHGYTEPDYSILSPTISYTSKFEELDCDKCPNKPDFKNGSPVFGDSPCTWCRKNQFYCK